MAKKLNNEEIALKEADKGTVYFLQSENGGPIKIGFTTNLQHRVSTLQTSLPYKLKVLFSVECHLQVEKILHDKFKAHRLNGEWFKDVPEIHNEIEQYRLGNIPEYKIYYKPTECDPYNKVFRYKFDCFLSRENVSDSFARMFLSVILNCYISPEGQLLLKRGVQVNTNKLIEVSGMTNRSGFRAMNELINQDILRKEKSGRNYVYYANPYLISSSDGLEQSAYVRFRDSKWRRDEKAGGQTNNSRAEMEIEKMFSDTEWAKALD